MTRKLSLCAAAALLVLHAPSAYAWDDFGHRLVARIAWEQMTPAARDRAVQILRGAPLDTRLRPSAGSLSAQQQVNAFIAGATWPDDVRPGDPRSTLYHKRDRHFTDLFWRQNSDFSPILASERPDDGDLLRDMPQLRQDLLGTDAEKAAVALAWLLHVVGDIHQPLHASSRITESDPAGDGGGNRFCLIDPAPNGCRFNNLHALWDGSVTAGFRWIAGEHADTYLTRVAQTVMQRHPPNKFASEMGETEPGQWAQASVRIAKRRVYRAPLVRNHPAPSTYRRAAFRTAEPRIALAGYRLAALLNEALT
ncbi:MAG TPA: S1/P1 nuclease [Longimicrobium sp.]|nr:S1/P1 nuclease [Longimicrobium sp.]